jgi:hypothetical protein
VHLAPQAGVAPFLAVGFTAGRLTELAIRSACGAPSFHAGPVLRERPREVATELSAGGKVTGEHETKMKRTEKVLPVGAGDLGGRAGCLAGPREP